MRSIYFGPITALLLTACNQSQPAIDPVSSPEEPAAMSYCALRDPTNIQAWIDTMPGGHDNPTLIVQFKAIAPTPGYSFDLKHIETMESMSPIFVYDLIATAPTDPVIQVETEIDVRIEKSGLEYSELAGLEITCGGEPFISLDEVETAH